MKTNEFRYLLDIPGRKLPEYFEYLLVPVWDQILFEFDKLNGDNTFSNAFKDTQADIQELNELIIMKSCYNLMLLGQNIALTYLSNECGIEISEITHESIERLGRKIRQTEMRMQIVALEKGDDQAEDEQSGSDYIKSIVQMSNILGRQLDKDKITIAEWVYCNKECQKLIKVKNGSGNQVF